MIRAVLAGGSQARAAEAGKMSLEEAGAIYNRFFEKLALAMFGCARQFVEASLGASSTIDPLRAILNANGVFHPDQIDRRGKPDLVHPSRNALDSGDLSQDDDELLRVIRTALGIYRWEQIDGFTAILNANGIYRWEQIDDTKPGCIHPKILASRSRKESGQPIEPLLAVLNALGICLWEQLDDSQPGWVHPRERSKEALAPVDKPVKQFKKRQPRPEGPFKIPASNKPIYTNRIGERIEYLPDGWARITDADGTVTEGPEAEIEAQMFDANRVVSGEFADAMSRYPKLENHALSIELTDVVEELVPVVETVEPHKRHGFVRNAIDEFMGGRKQGKSQTQPSQNITTQMRLNI